MSLVMAVETTGAVVAGAADVVVVEEFGRADAG